MNLIDSLFNPSMFRFILQGIVCIIFIVVFVLSHKLYTITNKKHYLHIVEILYPVIILLLLLILIQLWFIK